MAAAAQGRVWANSYIEGWAVYAEQMMEAQGENGGDAVKAHLVALKADLRMYANVHH